MKSYNNVEKIKEGFYIQPRIVDDKIVGWKRIHPIVKDITQPFTWNNIHWKNFLIGGSWFNVLIVLLLLFALWSYKHDMQNCLVILENTTSFCKDHLTTQLIIQ